MVESDLGAVALLDRESYPGRHWCQEAFERHYHGHARCAVAVATTATHRKDGIIGYMAHALDRRGRVTRLIRLGVAAERRRLGIGGSLLARALAYALKHDYPIAVALEATLEDDLLPGAHALMQDRGYTQVPDQSGNGTDRTTFRRCLREESYASFPGVD